MAIKPGDKYYTGLMLRFGDTLRNWAMQSAQQLRDSYKMQKVWNGTRSNSVWMGRGTRTIKLQKIVTKPDGTKAKDGSSKPTKKTINNYSWYDEVWRRREMQKRNPTKEYWYPTGMSYQISQHNPVTVIDDSIESGTVDFHTTLGALYAEAGVGANGLLPGVGKNGKRKPKTRPRHIKVFRKDPWTHTRRYTDWIPGQGRSVRPNTRQQVNLLTRRLKWAARLIYQHDLTTYIAYMLGKSFQDLGTWVWTVDASGLPVGLQLDPERRIGTVTGKDGETNISWEEFLKKYRQ